MKIFHTIAELKTNLRADYSLGKSIGFVPTMGALHEGHASLVRKSALENKVTVVSIFVNPTQFGPNEDLDKYPRTLEADCQLVNSKGATYVFAPSAKEMYPFSSNEITFSIKSLDEHFCGEKRKGHFNGVIQVVTKLFNIVQPTRAYFGLKDFQQYTILKRLADELFFPIEVVGCPIVRESDGLAMSSRNVYLNPEERKQALFLSRALMKVKKSASQTQDVSSLRKKVQRELEDYPAIRLDYFDVCHPQTLQILENFTEKDDPVALIAAYAGATRLIDNMYLFD